MEEGERRRLEKPARSPVSHTNMEITSEYGWSAILNATQDASPAAHVPRRGEERGRRRLLPALLSRACVCGEGESDRASR